MIMNPEDTIAFEFGGVQVGRRTIHTDKGTYLISEIKSLRYDPSTPFPYEKIFYYIGFAICGLAILTGQVAGGLFALGLGLWFYHVGDVGRIYGNRKYKIYIETSKGETVIYEMAWFSGTPPRESWYEDEKRTRETVEYIIEGIRNAIERSGT
jgi:hypothetical protein